LTKELLNYSFENNLAHIPSALSMLDYISVVFKYIKKTDNIIIGKPFGAQTYYLVWKHLGWLKDIQNLHMGVKHDEVDFVLYSEETIGNALGVAAGVALVSDKKTYVNLSDAALQMGNTLEAIQFIGQHKLDVLVTVDYNGSQVTGNTKDIIDVTAVIEFFKNNSFKTYITDGHNKDKIHEVLKEVINFKEPTVIFFETKKGYPFKEMMDNIKQFHYRKLNEKDVITFSEQI
jgi:transketolase N-terminal domain/subunit